MVFLRSLVIFARLTTEKVPEAAAEPTKKDDDFKACNDILIIPAHKATEDTEYDKDPASNDENECEPVEAPITGLVKENIKS